MFTFFVFCDLYLPLKLCTYLSLISYICLHSILSIVLFSCCRKITNKFGKVFIYFLYGEKKWKTQKLAQRITLAIWCPNYLRLQYILDIHDQRMPLTWKSEMFKESFGRINTPSPFAKFNFAIIKLQESWNRYIEKMP